MTFSRASGILVHHTAFPGRYGRGDRGAGARRVVDFLDDSKQKLWQVLPLGPTGYADSPYASFSAFAGNHLLLAPERLAEQGWLDARELARSADWPEGSVEYGLVSDVKLELLRRAHERFRRGAAAPQLAALDAFCQANRPGSTTTRCS